MPDPHDRRSALALSDAGGHGRVARVGLASAIVGQLIIAAAGVIWPSNRDLGGVLFSVSPILTGAGLVTAGVAIIRAGVWARPSRFLPLTLGLYTILLLIPVMIASGGPPAPLALWTIGGWDMLWFVLSASLLRFTPAPFRATRQWPAVGINIMLRPGKYARFRGMTAQKGGSYRHGDTSPAPRSRSLLRA